MKISLINKHLLSSTTRFDKLFTRLTAAQFSYKAYKGSTMPWIGEIVQEVFSKWIKKIIMLLLEVRSGQHSRIIANWYFVFNVTPMLSMFLCYQCYYNLSWPSGHAYRGQVLMADSSECGFKSRSWYWGKGRLICAHYKPYYYYYC